MIPIQNFWSYHPYLLELELVTSRSNYNFGMNERHLQSTFENEYIKSKNNQNYYIVNVVLDPSMEKLSSALNL